MNLLYILLFQISILSAEELDTKEKKGFFGRLSSKIRKGSDKFVSGLDKADTQYYKAKEGANQGLKNANRSIRKNIGKGFDRVRDTVLGEDEEE